MLINGKIGHCGYKNRIVRRSQILLFYTSTHNADEKDIAATKTALSVGVKFFSFIHLRTMPLK